MDDYHRLRKIMEEIREEDEHIIVDEQEEEINRGHQEDLDEVVENLRKMEKRDGKAAEVGDGQSDQTSEAAVIQRDI